MLHRVKLPVTLNLSGVYRQAQLSARLKIRVIHLRFWLQGNFHISYTITDEISLSITRNETSTHHIGSPIYLLCKTNIWNYKNKRYTCMLQQLKMWTTYQQSYDYND